MLFEVIKIGDEDVFVINENGDMVKTSRADVDWDIKIGDVVDVYTNGEKAILKLIDPAKPEMLTNTTLMSPTDFAANPEPVVESENNVEQTNVPYKEKMASTVFTMKPKNGTNTTASYTDKFMGGTNSIESTNSKLDYRNTVESTSRRVESINKPNKKPSKFLMKFSEFLRKKNLPVIFCLTFVAMIAALIVIAIVPHGWNYTYSEKIYGMELKLSVKLSGDEATMNVFGLEDTTKYKIEKGSFYFFDQEEDKFVYAGKISSTKLVFEDETGKTTLVEKTMKGIQTFCIIVLVISGLCAAGSITVIVLDKKRRANTTK